MKQSKVLKGLHRRKLLKMLHAKYENPSSFNQKIRFFRKKYLWIIFVEGAKFFKRGFDILLSILLLTFFSPLMLLIFLTIKLSDGGPVLFVTKRVGKWGREFSFPKFRSMKIDSHLHKEELSPYNKFPEDIKFKMLNDPRVTPLGFLLRKSSLDELPQLWCVLKGDMSLVGPRPPLPEEVANYSLEQRKRLDAVPGLTCIWQVSGRSEIPFEKQVELDVAYIESRSFWLDIKLLLKTIPSVLFGKGPIK
jgi:lipopolysaccharide/colanic/teichoic acid biosynthesis glycosyltransferase